MAAPVVVQHKHGASGASPVTVSFAATQAGNLLLAFVSGGGYTAVPTYTTPTGWTLLDTLTCNININISLSVFYLPNCSAGLTSLSITAANANGLVAEVYEISGAPTASPIDAHVKYTATAYATTHTISATATGTTDLAIGATSIDVTNGTLTLTTPTGWTRDDSNQDSNGFVILTTEEEAQTASGTVSYAPSWGRSTDYMMSLVLISPAGGGGGGNTYNQPVSEYQSALDTRLSRATRPVAGDSTFSGDVSVRNIAKLAADTTSGADQQAKMATRPALDAQSGLDALAKSPQKVTFDVESGFDSLSKATQAVLGDPLSALDSLSRLWSAHLALYEAISGLDSVQKAVFRRLLEALSETDSLTESNQVLSGQNYSKMLVETLSETDALAALALTKLLGDAYAASDSRMSQIGRPLYDVSSEQDQVTRTFLALLVDAGVLSDAQQKQIGTTLADVTAAVDRVTAGKVLLLTLLDQASLLDVEMTSYTKIQYGLLAMLTSFVASTLGVNISFANSPQVGATVTLLASALAMTCTIPF